MAKKLTYDELINRAEEAKKQANELMKQAKKLEKEEARKKAILEEQKRIEEAKELYKVAETATITINGKDVTVLEYLRMYRDEMKKETK